MSCDRIDIVAELAGRIRDLATVIRFAHRDDGTTEPTISLLVGAELAVALSAAAVDPAAVAGCCADMVGLRHSPYEMTLIRGLPGFIRRTDERAPRAVRT